MSGYRCCEHCAQATHHEPWADGHDIPCGVHQCHGADWLRDTDQDDLFEVSP